MANLTYTRNRYEKGFNVIDVDKQVTIGFFENESVAASVAKSGNDSPAALARARAEDFNLSGGIQTTPSTGATTSPVTPQTNIQPTELQPVSPSGVTYTGTRSLTPEEQEALVRRINSQGPAATIDYSKDPLYKDFYGNRTNPPPPQLVTAPAAAGNPPNPQVPSGPPGTAVNGAVTVQPSVINDDAASTNTGDPLATLDTVAVPSNSDLTLVPEPVSSQTVFFPDGRVLEVAAGEFVDEQGFVGTETGIRRLAEDVAIDNTEEIPEGGIVEFTAGGQRIVDAENPDFVITPGGLRVAAEDIDTEVDTEGSDLVREPTEADIEEAALAQAALDRARQQASVSALRKANGKATGDGDWRVRLRLAPNAYYLYKNETPGILQPLQETDGVIFPYTPRIDMVYSAEYNPTDLIHSNYRGYFYKGSKVGEIVLTADFTAQDTKEADYLLATIHFFRSCTKMFYGQDDDRGAPPPLVFLSGLGEFQFNEHPCVISQFNYNLPSDVDYIRSRGRQSTSAGVTQGGNGLMFRRTLTGSATASYSLTNIIDRLRGANLPQGGVNIPPPPPNLGLNSPTYVPTKMSISLTLLPMPTRSQVSQQFSLEKYANGNLLRGGFW